MVTLSYFKFRLGRRQQKRVRTAGAGIRCKKNPASSPEAPGKKRKGSESDCGSGSGPKGGLKPGSDGTWTIDLQDWMDAPGLDVEDRFITAADLQGECGWFGQHRPQPGPQCLPLHSYKTLGDLGRLRVAIDTPQEVAGTFARMEDVPGHNDCFYPVIAIELMSRLGVFPQVRKSHFWTEIGVYPGLLRWGAAAFQRTMLGKGALCHLCPAWLGLTRPGQAFSHPGLAQSVLRNATLECEGERSWMGSTHGEYAVLTDIRSVIIRVFSPLGCTPDGTMSKAPTSQDPGLFSVAGAGVDILGQPGSRRCVVRAGDDVVQLKPSCIHDPLRCVMQAQVEAQASGQPREASFISMRAKEIALLRSCMVLGVIHDGSAHFMYPHVYPRLFNDFTGTMLLACNLSNGNASF